MNIKLIFSWPRVKCELFTPTRPLSRFLLDLIYSLARIRLCKSFPKERAVFVWDSRSNPVTFDFIYTLFWVSNHFSLLGFKKFDLILYRANNTKSMSFRGYDKIVSHQETIKRVNNIILAIAKLHPCVGDIKLVESLSEFQSDLQDQSACILPRYYSKSYSPLISNYSAIFKLWKDLHPRDGRLHLFEVPANIDLNNCFKAEDTPLISSFIINDAPFPEFVVLTLRDYGFAPERNTSQYDIDVAYKFANSLNTLLIVIPDDVSKLQNYILPDRTVICEAARQSLEIRVLLYSASIANIFRPCGPNALCYFIESAKSITVGYGAGGKEGDLKIYKNIYKFIPGAQPFINQNGYLIWAHNRPADSYDENDLVNALKLIS